MFRRRRPSPIPMPLWMQWGIIIFMLVIFALFYNSPQKNTVSTEITEKIRAEPYRKALDFRKETKLIEATKGTGALLVCGQIASLRYRLQEDTASTAPSEPQEITFHVGSKDSPTILERSILGAHVGSVRRLQFSPAISASTLLNRSTDTSNEEKQPLITGAEIELLSATPGISELMNSDKTSLGLTILDQTAGLAPAVLCGDEVTLRLRIWDAQGVLLNTDSENEQKFHVRIGSNSLPLGIEQSVIGMQKGGKRMVLLPPHWQKPLIIDENSLVQTYQPLHKLGLPLTSFVIAQLELIAIEPYTTPKP